MNQNDDILPIGELPEKQREAFRLIEASLQSGDQPTARTHMGELLEYYVGIDREIPVEVEVAYARLLVLENPTLDFAEMTRQPLSARLNLSAFDEKILKSCAVQMINDATAADGIAALPTAQKWACDMLDIPTMESLEEFRAFLANPENSVKPVAFKNAARLDRGALLALQRGTGHRAPIIVTLESLAV